MVMQSNEAFITPELYLASVRIAMPDADELFTRGRCFQLYRMLKTIWQLAECWYDPIDGHVYTKIGETFYDIRGARTLPERAHIVTLAETPTLYADAHTWR